MGSDDSSSDHEFVSPAHCAECMQSWLPPGSVPEAEPPMTSEEEEEVSEPSPTGCGYPSCACAPEERCYGHRKVPFVQTCVKPGCVYDPDRCRNGCAAALDDRWAKAMGDDEPPPPQPERRPPYAVAYSVGGHLYEAHVPGDAAVKAVDGALIIQHHLGPVAGIVQVLPVINEGGAGGAEADQ